MSKEHKEFHEHRRLHLIYSEKTKEYLFNGTIIQEGRDIWTKIQRKMSAKKRGGKKGFTQWGTLKKLGYDMGYCDIDEDKIRGWHTLSGVEKEDIKEIEKVIRETIEYYYLQSLRTREI